MNYYFCFFYLVALLLSSSCSYNSKITQITKQQYKQQIIVAKNYLSEDNIEIAKQILQNLAKTNQGKTANWLDTKAIILFKTSQYSKAQSSFEKAIKLQPNNAQILNNYGNLLYEMEKYDKALVKFNKAIANSKSTTSHKIYLHNKSLCLNKLKTYNTINKNLN